MAAERVRVIDSHTGGEPTRVVVAGGPDWPGLPLAERRLRFQSECDGFRSGVVLEPRGSEVLVGALLCEPSDRACATGVLFFNNVGVLNMCGHGAIGVVRTLAHLGRIGPGPLQLETPVGTIACEYHGGSRVSFENVPSYRSRHGVELALADGRRVVGDVAWGGNWFFLCEEPHERVAPDNLAGLLAYTGAIREAIAREGLTGEAGGEIDHIELFGPPSSPGADSRSFVLCPGGAYDRSPCGTGTSAHLACLAAEGRLGEGEVWRQESIIGSLFEGSYRRMGEKIVPRITGEAHITGEAELLFSPDDPFREGIRP